MSEAAPATAPPARGRPLGAGFAQAFRLAGEALRLRLFEPEYPLTAVEVRPSALGVVRLVREGGRWSLGAAASLDLPEHAVQVSMAQPNILDAEAFGKTLQAVLERAGVLGGGRVSLVLPDPVARVSLLPAADILGKSRADTAELIRFRLKKAVPFNIREAHVAWLPTGVRGADAQMLVAAVWEPVLQGYEEALRRLGFHPGLVELSGLAVLDRVEQDRAPMDRLILNWDQQYVSLFLTRAGRPILVRTLAGAGVSAPEAVAREVESTLLYYRERLGGSGLGSAVVRAAAWRADEVEAALQESLGFRPEVLDPWSELGAGERKDLLQGLVGAVSSIQGRAA